MTHTTPEYYISVDLDPKQKIQLLYSSYIYDIEPEETYRNRRDAEQHAFTIARHVGNAADQQVDVIHVDNYPKNTVFWADIGREGQVKVKTSKQ